MIRNCDTCYHRKTDRCPNSSECYETENKPYYEPTLETIEKLTPNDLIEMLNPELIKLNKQYENEKQQLIKFLEDKIKEIDKTMPSDLICTASLHADKLAKVNAYQEVLDLLIKAVKNEIK